MPDDGSMWAAQAASQACSLIDRYEEVAQLSRGMLAAAQRDDWDEVVRLETRCQLLIEYLKRAARIEPLSPNEQRRRIALLRDILRDDAKIRARAEPWLLELERLIGLPGRARRAG